MSHIGNTPPRRDAGLDVPAAGLRSQLQLAAIRLRAWGAANMPDAYEAAALADALEDYAAGEMEAAHEALDAARVIRRGMDLA